ncbi:hypothetical protein DICPUDRAFT_83714 [Dictyostelium purpureum]|uniref:Uncharacterized protein n=1 Tax=Dictyostelium purpureum TaxID=5786 RepID=F1A0D8_DICPU|nr:uncharacterized protein DICPUDRAFT_83714 [Dictyostelium purpureum]EGC30340.1 hypothetical protein DICPUDRAFT_83714 [Dictyostelium purpureum]|eukprot:XP_003293137.1 hypothetical protein DICPUDRAFT_83714 [Dictyostelium purpureum]
MDIYINDIDENIFYSPLIEKNLKSNYKYYSKYHLENVINNNISILEEILLKRNEERINSGIIIGKEVTTPFPFIKSEIGMNFKEKNTYCSIKDNEIKKKFLTQHIQCQIERQRGEIQPRVFIFSISNEQEIIYNTFENNIKKKKFIKEIVMNQIIQQMKFHLIVRKYYQNLKYTY